MLIFMAVILTLNFTLNKTMSSVPSGSEQDFLSQIITNNHYLIDLISATYPPAKLAANATVAYSELSGVVSLLLFLLTSAAAFFLCRCDRRKILFGSSDKGIGRETQRRESPLKRTVDPLCFPKHLPQPSVYFKKTFGFY